MDISEDETSITSVKGEGFASDLSDSEAPHNASLKPHQPPHHLKLSQRAKFKPKAGPSGDPSLKRPTTPMEIHQGGRKGPETLRPAGSRYKKQMSRDTSSNELNNSAANVPPPTGRFNEWDPYSKMERKKSPSVRAALLAQQQGQPQSQQLQQQPQQANSGFAHTFLGTDSSPRQASGRSQLGSANKSQMSPQANSQLSDVNCASNLDLMVSGQRLGGGRKELSPTSTPRDMGVALVGGGKQVDLHRPFTRRLQPLEKGDVALLVPAPLTPGKDPAAEGQTQVFMRTKK